MNHATKHLNRSGDFTTSTMRLVRQIQVKRTKLLDDVTFLSKNLFNVATWTVRHAFFSTRKWVRYNELWSMLKSHEAYRKLHEKCGSHPPQQVLRQVDANFKGFFEAMKSWKRDKTKFRGMPKVPRYKRRNGRNVVYFTSLQCRLRDGHVLLTKKMERNGFPRLKTDLDNVTGVRVVPFGDRYVIELVYDREPEDLGLDKDNVLGIDIGLTNIITTSDTIGGTPMIIKGGVVKSVNQFYNKSLARYKSISKICNDTTITNRILRLHRKRNNKIKDFFHKTSRMVIDHCIRNDIGTVVVGYNEGWKQKVNLGRRTNQNFVSVPFLKLIQQLEYKAELVGIEVIRTSEEYTSQTCSSCGIVRKANRKHRGLYVCKACGMVLNADVNASLNIMEKGVPQSFGIGNRGHLDCPVVFAIF